MFTFFLLHFFFWEISIQVICPSFCLLVLIHVDRWGWPGFPIPLPPPPKYTGKTDLCLLSPHPQCWGHHYTWLIWSLKRYYFKMFFISLYILAISYCVHGWWLFSPAVSAVCSLWWWLPLVWRCEHFLKHICFLNFSYKFTLHVRDSSSVFSSLPSFFFLLVHVVAQTISLVFSCESL